MPVVDRRQVETATASPSASGGSSSEVALVGLRLRKPDQQCYALASLCWLGNSLTVQAAAQHPFFRALRSLSQMRLNTAHHLLSMHDWRQLCVGWHRPRQQHDVHEYLLHVLVQGPAVEWLLGPSLRDAWKLRTMVPLLSRFPYIISTPTWLAFPTITGLGRTLLLGCLLPWSHACLFCPAEVSVPGGGS